MKLNIRHPRLYAFCNSKTLNLLSIFIAVMLPLHKNVGMSIPILSAIGVAFILMVAYSCWLWFWKPNVITINPWLSDMSGYFVIFMLVAVAVKSDNFLWSTFPLVAFVVLLFISAIKGQDQQFNITQADL